MKWLTKLDVRDCVGFMKYVEYERLCVRECIEESCGLVLGVESVTFGR